MSIIAVTPGVSVDISNDYTYDIWVGIIGQYMEKVIIFTTDEDYGLDMSNDWHLVVRLTNGQLFSIEPHNAVALGHSTPGVLLKPVPSDMYQTLGFSPTYQETRTSDTLSVVKARFRARKTLWEFVLNMGDILVEKLQNGDDGKLPEPTASLTSTTGH
jgi:hypothetical protein